MNDAHIASELEDRDLDVDAPKAVPQEPKKPRVDPATVPYVNDTVTYASRRREIVLLLTLIEEKKDSLLDELRFVDHCTKYSDYPNINFVDPTSRLEE